MDCPVYADTVDIQALAFHHVWGCLLTPHKVAARIGTDDLRYHLWVAAMRVVQSGRVHLADRHALVQAVLDRFMLELGLVLLDLFPGPLVLFVDPRLFLHDRPQQFVARAAALAQMFDDAGVPRARIVLTVPATEDGVRAANTLASRYGVRTHLALVACRAHATACLDARPSMISMSVAPIMQWFERAGTRVVARDHPGIVAIQACASLVRRHGTDTTLLTTDVREWTELAHLDGIGATALTRAQLDQIPMRRLTTGYLRLDDDGADADPHTIDHDGGFMASLSAEDRSAVTAVLYGRLARMAAQMDLIEQVAWVEIKRRVWLETTPLEGLYRRPPVPHCGRCGSAGSSRTSRSASRSGRSRSRPRSRHRETDDSPYLAYDAEMPVEGGLDRV